MVSSTTLAGFIVKIPYTRGPIDKTSGLITCEVIPDTILPGLVCGGEDLFIGNIILVLVKEEP